VTSDTYLLLADAVLLLHVSVVLFIVGGQLFILLGALCGWQQARNFRFRALHLAAIVVVALQAWLGVLCPLTTLEMALRRTAGVAAYEESFIAHWLSRVLYYDLPGWVFVLAYTLFGFLVVVSWYWEPPRRNPR